MSVFRFKYFEVQQKNASMKVGFDAMILGALTEVNSELNILDIVPIVSFIVEDVSSEDEVKTTSWF